MANENKRPILVDIVKIEQKNTIQFPNAVMEIFINKKQEKCDISIKTKIGNFEQSPTFSMMIKLSVAAEFDLPQALSQNYPYPESELVQNELLGKDPLFYSAVNELKKLSPQQLKLACKILADIAEENL